MSSEIKAVGTSLLLTVGQFLHFANEHTYKILSIIFLALQIAIAIKNLKTKKPENGTKIHSTEPTSDDNRIAGHDN